MISCIICSANKELLKQVSVSIEETIGLPFEIIGIDNVDGKFGICAAYNKGAALAKFDILCFLHEDILFETNDWGSVLAAHFKNLTNAGVIGVAGSSYKTLSPSGWWMTADDNYLCYHYRQSYKRSKKEMVLQSLNGDAVKKVICLDGMFLAVKKEVYKKYGFDNSIPLFHGYDQDFTLAVTTGFQNYFVPDILLHHLSEGNTDDTWLKSLYMLFKKWNKQLPMMIDGKATGRTESLIWQQYCRLVFASSIGAAKKLKILMNILWVKSCRQKSLIPLYGFLRSVAFAMLKN